jgi:ABC-type Zn uptake system ZnuABC Zn-binding protein ZnuA
MDLPYLAARYGFEVVGTIEYKPGVPATPSHLEELVALGQREHIDLVVHEVSYEDSLSQSLAGKLGAPMVTVSVTTGGLPNASTYLTFVEANLQALVQALHDAKAPQG